MSWDKKTLDSIRNGYGGDTYRRVFVGDKAQCGCYWSRESGGGDVLKLCPIHREHTNVTNDYVLTTK